MSVMDWTEAKKAAGKAGYVIDTESFERVFEKLGIKPMNIIEQIKALPDGETLHDAPITDGITCEVMIDNARLKALAESHERLLEAAKAVYSPNVGQIDIRVQQYRELKSAIEQAEKL